MKTRFTLEAEYDPDVTHPDGLAVALDQLLETALSTPGILDDYANPTFGEFFVAQPGLPQAPGGQGFVVVNVHGGVVQDVYASKSVADVVVVDWDTEPCSPEDPGIVTIEDDEDHGPELAAVGQYAPEPLEAIAGTDVERALESAGITLPQDEPDGLTELVRYVVYDHDLDHLVSNEAFEDREDAIDLASRLQDAMVLKLIIPCLKVGPAAEDSHDAETQDE